MKNGLYFVCGGLLLSLLAPLPAIAQVASEPNLVAQTPLPPPLLLVSPASGRISVRMINTTGATLNYEVIGDTQYRTLGGQSEALLQTVSVPTTIAFRRQDGGLLQVSLRTTPTGVLELTLSATTDFSLDRTALNIDAAGGVYLN